MAKTAYRVRIRHPRNHESKIVFSEKDAAGLVFELLDSYSFGDPEAMKEAAKRLEKETISYFGYDGQKFRVASWDGYAEVRTEDWSVSAKRLDVGEPINDIIVAIRNELGRRIAEAGRNREALLALLNDLMD